jgi:asparagine synthase (glutamine-hydrolysing)
MCGFVGIVNFDKSPIDIGVLSKMTEIQKHRGPDDEGRTLFSLNDGTFKGIPRDCREGKMPFSGGLGFNRLSILDLSSHGSQPMVSTNKNAIIAFNGEIYNAFELRPELEQKGYSFRSNTDTEVILNLFDAFGFEGMLARLNGMFAICVIDLKAKRILLARDRLGIKPLYISRIGQTLLFSSEVKSFLHHPSFVPELDSGSLDEYLTFRYCSGSNHLISNVEQVKPGCWLSISSLNDQRQASYWQIPDVPSIVQNKPLEESIENAVTHLERSVQSQLLSDAKLGCQLSGGIDSSLINLLASRNANDNLDAFSVTFKDPAYSERKWIDSAAQRSGVTSHCFELDAEYFAKNISKASWHLDQPLNHPNSLGLMFLAENACSYVKVLLSGEGADESLGGYARYYYAKARLVTRPFVNSLNRVFRNKMSKISRRLGGSVDRVEHFLMSSSFLDSGYAGALRSDYNYESVIERRRALFMEGNSPDHTANCLKYDMRTYLVDLLIRQDKMTMASSVENRVPFLDHNWIEFVRNEIPMNHLVCVPSTLNPRNAVNRGTKVVLKKMARKYFDESFVFRRKAGFAIPMKQFFKQSLFREQVEDTILPGIASRNLLNHTYVNRLWSNLDSIGSFELEALWAALSVEFWIQSFKVR